ncbi:protein of unknown function [Taphrina deformans PYCC 5710]|uniref:Uncharacterized protein n=1 Tax=Taphrina deformans (strain PYCC 5710 / ATCC 11124 / CBS 356.35 / IMI 108563 / JCM 9778 / NBRC 8474) TaxID=1097556 RepID=R4XG51_TAPDE|nr:protein of unknown function [Taphrina deformans PYCC 5710]|eukprot:CCG84710.1 protein of unknown function [Taphrina deformans PYCC 5710]
MTTTLSVPTALPDDQALLTCDNVTANNAETETQAQEVTPPQSPRSYSPHPLEAHLLQLEEYEAERPPFYNQSTLAPDLIFSAESLRHEAKILARILLSFMAYAIHTHGTTNSCDIGIFGRFELWPNRPPEANSMAATVLNEKNIVYTKAVRYAERDLEERGLYIKRFAIKQDKKRQATIAEWSIQMTPVLVNQQYPHHNHVSSSGRFQRASTTLGLPSANDLVRMHHESHAELRAQSRPQSRSNSHQVVVERRRTTSGLNNEARQQPRPNISGIHSRGGRTNDRTNEFGYYGNKCTMM